MTEYDHYEFLLITPQSYEIAIRAAARGFEDARLTVMLVNQAFSAMEKSPMECLCRDCKELLSVSHRPTAFAICVPMFPKPKVLSHALSCAVCEKCASRPDLLERMLESLREICPSATLMEPQRTRQ